MNKKNDKTNRCKGDSMEGRAIVFRGGITTDAQSKNHKLMTFKETKHTVELVSGETSVLQHALCQV